MKYDSSVVQTARAEIKHVIAAATLLLDRQKSEDGEKPVVAVWLLLLVLLCKRPSPTVQSD